MKRITLKKRHTLRKDLVTDLEERLAAEIGDISQFFSGGPVEVVETDSALRVFMVGKQPLLMMSEGWVFPTLRGLLAHPIRERNIVVDQGAVSYVAGGADVMRPGIVSLTDDVKRGSPVQVTEVRHGKPLAVAIALADTADIREMKMGKAAKTFHHVGDPLWSLEI
jgi:PUA domain protein